MNKNWFLPLGVLISFLVIFLSPVIITSLELEINVNQALAQEEPDSYKFLEPIPGVGSEINVENDFSDFVQTLITMMIGFAILAAIIMIVFAGFEYLTSRSPDDTSNAKERIQNAVLGLVLALASVVILQTINPQLIELKSVSTVTTTGSTFTIPEEGFGGTVYIQGSEQFGNKFCFHIDGEAKIADLFFGDTDEDRYVCYNSRRACEEGEAAAVEEVGEGGSGVEESCRFWYEATALVEQDKGKFPDYAQDQYSAAVTKVVRIDRDKEDVVNECKSTVNYLTGEGLGALPDDEELTSEWESKCIYGQTAEEERPVCKVLQGCSRTQDEPLSLPDEWDRGKACPASIADSGSSFCKDTIAACEITSPGGVPCYLTPTQMFGSEPTRCYNCTFVSDLPGEKDNTQSLLGRFKYGNMCSGDGDYCRIEKWFADELIDFHDMAVASNTIAEFDYEITEVFPPTYQHAKDCHYNGTCVDVGVRPVSIRDGNDYPEKVEYIRKVISAAEQSGMKACYEVKTQEEADNILAAAQEAGIDSLNEENVFKASITEDHFSVYKNENESCKGS